MNRPLVTHNTEKRPGCPAGRHLCARAASELSSEQTAAYETAVVIQESASTILIQQQCAGGLNTP